uniref:TPR_REGION domain-containing protein n=1 Tax=Heterorhabditis bacteriophora TaxID=37862 RepID=A0A1I7WRK8_HETBA
MHYGVITGHSSTWHRTQCMRVLGLTILDKKLHISKGHKGNSSCTVHPHSLAEAWSDEFTNQQLQKDMAVEWETIQRNVALAQGDDISRAKDDIYVHQVENQYLALNDPLSEGDSLMQAGDLGNAMLAYEAAVQKNPQDANVKYVLDLLQAWCKLGLSHAENEHDTKAIAAFNNCLKIQPDNQEALLALSVSLANESLENDSLNQLERWLIVHQGGDPTKVKNRAVGYSSFLDHAAFKRPDDPRLWNRLGATLANGDKTVEAISAYREAISKYPSYVRARYNLGISCMHLNSYRNTTTDFEAKRQKSKSEVSDLLIRKHVRNAQEGNVIINFIFQPMVGKLLYSVLYLSTIGAKSILKFHDSLEYQNKIPGSTDYSPSNDQQFITVPSLREENCDSDESIAAEALQSTLENNFNLKVPRHIVDAQGKREVLSNIYEISDKSAELQTSGSKKNTDDIIENDHVKRTIPILRGDVNSNEGYAEQLDTKIPNDGVNNNIQKDLQKTNKKEDISNAEEPSGLNASNNIPIPESLPIIKHSLISTTHTIEDKFIIYSMPISPTPESTPYTIALATLNKVPVIQPISNRISEEQTDFLDESHTMDDGDNDLAKNHFAEKTTSIDEHIHDNDFFSSDAKSADPTFKVDLMSVTESPLRIMNSPTPAFNIDSIKNIINEEPKEINNLLATHITVTDSDQLNNNEDSAFLSNENENNLDAIKEQDEDLPDEVVIKPGCFTNGRRSKLTTYISEKSCMLTAENFDKKKSRESLKIVRTGYRTVAEPVYSSDLSPTDYHFSKHLDSFLPEKVLSKQTAAQNAFEEFIGSRSPEFEATGITSLFLVGKNA